MRLWELFQQGGGLMWPILVCSILAVAITVERLVYFLRHGLNVSEFLSRMEARVRAGDVDGARKLAEQSRNPVATLANRYLAHLGSKLSVRENALTREAGLAIEQARARLRGLEIIAQVAPLIGLLGTVTGMIEAFHAVQEAGGANVTTLAGGIWSALLTTAFGLSVAIPTMLAHHWFEGRVQRTETQMQYLLSVFNEIFAQGMPGVAPVDPVRMELEAPAESAVGG